VQSVLGKSNNDRGPQVAVSSSTLNQADIVNVSCVCVTDITSLAPVASLHIVPGLKSALTRFAKLNTEVSSAKDLVYFTCIVVAFPSNSKKNYKNDGVGEATS
jgi:hypothetical protein